MKKSILLFVLILFLLSSLYFVHAQETQSQEDIFSYQSLIINWSLSNQISSQSSKVIAVLNLYPREDYENGQTVNLQASAFPQAEITKNDNITFTWKKNAEGSLNLGVAGLVSRTFTLQKIFSNIKYPQTIPSDIRAFTEPSTFADSDNQYVKLKAQEILTSSSSDDLLEIIYNIAKYVSESTEYDLTYFAEIKPASWVLQNKKGVCDEYTNLFIALSRALGIPARYVSGIAYSNIENKFTEHAWAEVYVDGKWLPYDTTFNQYGWIDSTHIFYGGYTDAKDASTAISYSYLGGSLSASNPITNAIIILYGQKLQPLTKISSKLLANKTGLNSYIPLEVDITNLQPYYLSVPIILNMAPGVYGKNSQNVFLKPNSENKIYFIIHVSSDQCKKRFICEFTIGLKTIFGDNVTTQLTVSDSYPSLSLEEAQAMIQAQKPQLVPQILSCLPDRQEYYSYENISILCSVNADEQLQICLRNSCKPGGAQIKQASFTLSAENETGTFNIIAKRDSEVVAFSSFSVKILLIPILRIKSIENSKKIVYGDEMHINLTVEASEQIDTNISIEKIGIFPARFLKGMNKVQVPFNSLKLGAGQKSLEVKISFKDRTGQVYSVKDFAEFEIQDVSFLQKIWIWLRNLFRFAA